MPYLIQLAMYARSQLLLLVAIPCATLYDVSARADEAERRATPVSSVTVHDGFRVELLRSARPDEGSWISMTFDDRGRLYLGLDDRGIARLTLAKDPADQRIEVVENSLRHCRGVLYAHDSLYVCATDSKGFYRLRDTTDDDQLDEVQLLKTVDYCIRMGHGSNQVVLGPDDMIYFVNGNDILFPEGVSIHSPYRDPRNDQLLPNPHDDGHDNRVGHILRTDPDGKIWEVMAGGMRNQFDIAFNKEGECFTFDADMELDVGLPWYRPTRVNHLVSGGEFGWRYGSGKWPDYYADSLPSNLDIGLASPTGMTFGYHSRGKFPARYQDALLMADWQHGRILLVDLTPRGASYSARWEVFLEGAPLNICDLEFGPDGALYFITGGRGSQSGLYRTVWIGPDESNKHPTNAVATNSFSSEAARQSRQVRKMLETWHVRRDPSGIDQIWPHLDSDDAWLRFAARIALENQNIDQWRQRALQESHTWGAITALMALTRQGNLSDRDHILAALGRIDPHEVDHTQMLALLRTYQLCFIRLGRPDDSTAGTIRDRFTAFYPCAAASENHLLCELLVYLKADNVVEKTLTLLRDGSTQEEQIRYMQMLTHADDGWSLSSRRTVLNWLIKSRNFHGGSLVTDALGDIQSDFLAMIPAPEQELLDDLIASLKMPREEAVTQTVDRPVVRDWTMRDLLPMLGEHTPPRSYENARRALLAASCLHCHRIGDSGGQIGPDLTNIGKRMDDVAILESILNPSKVIDPKYRNLVYRLADGNVVVGRSAHVSRTGIQVETDPLLLTTVTVDRSQIEEVIPSTTSPMPEGLVDILDSEDILNLVALLKAGGNPKNAVFQRE